MIKRPGDKIDESKTNDTYYDHSFYAAFLFLFPTPVPALRS